MVAMTKQPTHQDNGQCNFTDLARLDWMVVNMPRNAVRVIIKICALMDEHNTLTIRQTELADVLGIGRNTVQRNMYALKKLGTIRFKSIRFGVRIEVNTTFANKSGGLA